MECPKGTEKENLFPEHLHSINEHIPNNPAFITALVALPRIHLGDVPYAFLLPREKDSPKTLE